MDDKEQPRLGEQRAKRDLEETQEISNYFKKIPSGRNDSGAPSGDVGLIPFLV